MSATTSRSRRPVTLLRVFGYTALLGVLTAGTLSTAQVFRTTINPGLAVAYSAYALALAVPIGLAAAFLSLGIALGLRRISLRVTHLLSVASIVGGIGVVAAGGAMARLLTHEMFHDLQPIAWLAYAGCLVGGVAFLLWSLRCAEPAA